MSNVEHLAGTILFVFRAYLVCALTLAVVEGLSGQIFGADDTDSATQHSGLLLRTDFGTGCQYLQTTFGGVTPRLGADGHQICRSRR